MMLPIKSVAVNLKVLQPAPVFPIVHATVKLTPVFVMLTITT